jgi:predicted transcriptional regulator
MRILEDKGYITHDKPAEARAFVYHPLIGRDEAGRSAVRYLINRFFGDSPASLVQNLLDDKELSAKELRRIRKMLAEDAR